MSEQKFSQGAQGATVEQVNALIEQKVRAAVEEGSRRIAAELAEPAGWWNLYAYGPFQAMGPGGPLRPHKIIKAGETFFVSTVIWFSPIGVTPEGVSPCQLITNLGCDVIIDYCTGDICNWTKAPDQYSPRGIKMSLRPDQCWYIDTRRFVATAGTESLYEMNIMGRVTGCVPGARPPIAGFVTAVYDFDADVFYPRGGPAGQPPRWEYDIPIRFQIYS